MYHCCLKKSFQLRKFTPFHPWLSEFCRLNAAVYIILYIFGVDKICYIGKFLACENIRFSSLFAAEDVHEEERLQLSGRNSILMT